MKHRQLTEMEIIVAKEILTVPFDDGAGRKGAEELWARMNDSQRGRILRVARGVIRKMQKPTAAMIAAGYDNEDYYWDGAEAVWGRMIDAASPEEK